MGERPSEYDRDGKDFYVDPAWCTEALLREVLFDGPIHDPAAGIGTIVDACREFPVSFGVVTGADIVDRAHGKFKVQDFLKDDHPRKNVITNPPYKLAEAFAYRALMVAQRRVALLVNLKFLASQRRYILFQETPVEHVLVCSQRPSMPPGEWLIKEGEKIRGGGSIDFAWIVWGRGYNGRPDIRWIVDQT